LVYCITKNLATLLWRKASSLLWQWSEAVSRNGECRLQNLFVFCFLFMCKFAKMALVHTSYSGAALWKVTCWFLKVHYNININIIHVTTSPDLHKENNIVPVSCFTKSTYVGKCLPVW
jgi:hypothetical protein